MVTTQLKKGIVPLTLLFSMLPRVAAQTFTGDIGNIGDAMMRLFGPIFGANLLEGSNFAFWAKFLIWILLFAVFYWVFYNQVFKERKNIAVTVAAVVSAISALGMPESILRGIVESYTLVSTFILYIAPIAGLLYLMHRYFGDETRFNYIIKAVLFFLLAALLTHFTTAMQNAGIQSFNFTTGIASLAITVSILAGFYYIIRAIFVGPAGPAPAWPGFPGSGPSGPAPHPGPVVPPPDFQAQLNALQAAIARYNNIRERNLRVPAMRDILNANHARPAGGAYPYPYPYPHPTPAPVNWGAYTTAWNALVAQDGVIRGIIRTLQSHPDIARIMVADHTRFDTLVATDYANALLDTTTLLNDFAFHLSRNNPSPW